MEKAYEDLFWKSQGEEGDYSAIWDKIPFAFTDFPWKIIASELLSFFSLCRWGSFGFPKK